MKRSQEIVSFICDIPEDLDSGINVRSYPQLDSFFDKGLQIEDFKQTSLENEGKYIITFILRHYGDED